VVTLHVGGRSVTLTSPGKELWPGFTKRDLAEYYLDIAPVLLPHLAGRALTLGRFPDGVFGAGFAQTECRGRPEWLATRAMRLRSGQLRNYCLFEEPAALVWAANFGVLELHPFLHREDPGCADLIAFDLDPGRGAGLESCRELALALREALAKQGVAAVVKTSGGDGLHVYAPLASGQPYERVRRFARAVARDMSAKRPALAVDRSAKELRKGRVLIDWAQNNPSRSMVAPYSPRAAPQPWISTPLSWPELERADPERLRFTAPEVLERAAKFGDPFEAVLGPGATLPAV
jgi:bifunctional non-homologous end joining protein LigD